MSARDLIQSVVEPGFCIGCGACAALEGSPIEMRTTPQGRIQAALDDGVDAEGPYLEVCPFATSRSEDDLADDHLGRDTARDEEIGRYRSLHAGHVATSDLREHASSGGATTWFLAELLRRDLVDGVLHVTPTGEPDEHFRYAVSGDESELRGRSRTRYYPVEMSRVLTTVRTTPGRYAVVGVPCFIKAVRLLQENDPVFAERVRYCVGLVCGHFKSRRFTDALALEMGVPPEHLAAIDYRAKDEAGRADRYLIEVTDARTGQVHSRYNNELASYDWGHGYFKYTACDFCDDVLNETADVSFGDAWLPPYTEDGRGSNIIVARSATAEQILRDGSDDLALDPLSPQQVRASQAGGLRHRREGLAHRLERADREGRPVPRKRQRTGVRIGARRRRIYDLRSEMVPAADRAIAAALAAGDFREFTRGVEPLLARYRREYAADPMTRLKATVRRLLPGLAPVLRRLVHRIRYR